MFFPDEPKVGVKTIKQYAQMMKDENVNRAILVVQVNLTPHARQSLVEVQSRFLLEQVRRAITPTSLSPCPVTCFSGRAAPPRNPFFLCTRQRCRANQSRRQRVVEVANTVCPAAAASHGLLD